MLDDIKRTDQIERAVVEWQCANFAEHRHAAKRIQPLDGRRADIDEIVPAIGSLGRRPGPSSSRRGADGSKAETNGARIVEEAAALIHERGVAGTTLEDVKVAAEVSGSQMYHYFPDKNELVQAVIDYQADTIVTHQGHTLSSANGIEAWRNMVITAAKLTKAKGGCPLGSLGGQLAESDPEARALIAAGFDQWAAVIGEALRSLHADGKLPSDIDPDDLATTLLATLQGGLLLAQVHRSARPFETAIDTLLALAIGR